MGWASGSSIMVAVIEAVKKEVRDDKARKRIYKTVLAEMEMHDWDTQDEAGGIDPVFDKLLSEQ